MRLNNTKLEILIKGRPIEEYEHRGQTFIEGRESSEYEIRFVNSNNHRVEAVIAVDGLSIIDGKEASEKSSGYIVDANSSITIPGWMVDNTTAAHFAFSGKHESYATETTGSSKNNGVIGAMVFKEKSHPVMHYAPVPVISGPWGVGVKPWYSSGGPNMPWANYYNASGDISARNSPGLPASNGILRGLQSSVNSLKSPIVASGFSGGDFVEQSLGTEFGDATSFKTSTVSFERDDMVAMMVLYYDNKRGLKARGIVIEKVRMTNGEPQAFPGMMTGCNPPPGWKK